MNSEQKTNFALFASAKLNDKKIFEQYKDSIDNIIKNFDKEKYKFTIGQIKNKLLIEYIQTLGYEVIVKSQHINSLKSSNKKIIRESHGAIFFIFNKSIIFKSLQSCPFSRCHYSNTFIINRCFFTSKHYSIIFWLFL